MKKMILFILCFVVTSCACKISDRVQEIPDYFFDLNEDDYSSSRFVHIELSCCREEILDDSKVVIRIDDFCVFAGNYSELLKSKIRLPELSSDQSGYLVGVQVAYKNQLYKWGSDSFVQFKNGTNVIDLLYLGVEDPYQSLTVR